MAPATDDDDLLESDGGEQRCIAEGRIGQLVGGTYRIVRYLGSGGSSHVFAAEHQRLGKAFAVKLLRTELDSGRRAAQRFRREAKAVARLSSEHVVSVIDCGELDDGTPYLVMELLEGEDLRSLLNREGSLPARRAVQLVIEACRGLTVVHEAGLVHRDLKPENLFITKRATGADWCKVLDFGVAKMEASLSTAQGAIIGTVRYMAPEQLSDGAAVGPATDVYALGAVLYECLSGKPAHCGDSIQRVMFGVMNSEPEALAQLCPSLPDSLVAVVAGCLSKDPKGRPQTAAALAQALRITVQEQREGSADATLADDARAAIVSVRDSSRQVARSKWRAGIALTIAALSGATLAWSARPRPPVSPIFSTNEAHGPAALVKQPSTAQVSLSSSAPVALPVSAPAESSQKSAPAAQPSPSSRRSAQGHSARLAVPHASAAIGPFDPANPYGE
jgi:serine/threonine protein kinase